MGRKFQRILRLSLATTCLSLLIKHAVEAQRALTLGFPFLRVLAQERSLGVAQAETSVTASGYGDGALRQA